MDDSDSIPMTTYSTESYPQMDLPAYEPLPDISPGYDPMNPMMGNYDPMMGNYDPTAQIDMNMLPQFDPNMPMGAGMGVSMMPAMPMMPPMPMMDEMDDSHPKIGSDMPMMGGVMPMGMMPMGGMMGMPPMLMMPMMPGMEMQTEMIMMPAMPVMPMMPQPPQPQTITIQIDSNEVENRGRGRGRGRGRPKTMIESAKVERKKPKVPKKHLPIFIVGVSILEVGLLVWCIILNGGFEAPSLNPMLGPSTETLIKAGAKYAILIRNYGQWWRWFTPIFLHTGFVHIAFNLFMQLRVGVELEQKFGSYRVIAIYLLSGLAGNLLSCLFLPAVPTVGASGALFGFLGVLLVDILQNWKNLKNPWKDFIILIVSIVITLAMGLMPYLDKSLLLFPKFSKFSENCPSFAHIGGFVMGICAAIVFIPNLKLTQKKKLRILLTVIFIPVMAAIIIVMFVVFYLAVNVKGWCSGCQYISCLPISIWSSACKGRLSSGH